ncbi:MAG: hypothetical protein RLZZ519_702 [Bacteroidota bacterium]
MKKIGSWLLLVLIYVCGVLGALSLVTTLYSLANSGLLWGGGEIDLTKADQIGSLVGGFVGIFWTVMSALLLVRTLQIQKNEFRETQKAIQLQQFEAGFFQLLSQLQLVRESIKGKQTDEGVGVGYLEKAVEEFHKIYDRRVQEKRTLGVDYEAMESKCAGAVSQLGITEATDYKSFVNEVYGEFYKGFHPFLGHYFRFVHNIILFLVDSCKTEDAAGTGKLDAKDVRRYFYLLQAQLANAELVLLFYYALSSKSQSINGKQELTAALESNNMLENLEETSLLKRGHHHFYPKTVFKFLSLDERKVKSGQK